MYVWSLSFTERNLRCCALHNVKAVQDRSYYHCNSVIIVIKEQLQQ